MKFWFMAAIAVSLLIATSPVQSKPVFDVAAQPAYGAADAAVVYKKGRNRHIDANGSSFLPHPAGCPSRLFCACGAAVEVFGGNGRDWRSLWPARAWYKFPRTRSPSSGDVAVRKHHVFVLKSHVGGDVWLTADFNSGGRLSRLHEQSIRGYVIVSPTRSRVASLN